MKGNKVIINDSKLILSGISNENTDVIITIKERQSSIFFSSMNESDMISYTWYEGKLSIGDKLRYAMKMLKKT